VKKKVGEDLKREGKKKEIKEKELREKEMSPKITIGKQRTTPSGSRDKNKQRTAPVNSYRSRKEINRD
jgi:hypothetical protein